ncbi:MAG: putative nucleotidyltransferase substrate binding domain-containing protein [Actinomycetota bacterium]
MDVATFLSRYSPFGGISPDELAKVARSVEIEHFPAGTVILEQSGKPARYLYMVRKGAVELIAEGRLYDLLSEGEVFGQFSLLAHESPTSTVRAHEDTLCYLIGADVADEVLGTSAGQLFVLGRMRERLAAGHDAMEPRSLQLRPVGGLVRRAPVAAEPGMSVAGAAERMSAEHISCLLVSMRDGWGIVTDRDLRSRVLASHRNPETPVEEVASFPVKTLPENALVGEALLAMFAERVHHFPVTRPDGSIAGVVTTTDLMDIGRDTPFSIRGAIERARTRDEVVAAGRELPQVVLALVDASSEPVGVGRVVALVVDAMTTRLLTLGIERLGEPPVPWAWLALGSAARREQALGTDQDHALAYDPEDRPVAEVDPYFAELAEFVTDGLEGAGIPRCKGDAMATNPAMRRSVQAWVDALHAWMRDPGPSGSILSSIVYDFRRVTGPLDPEPELRATIFDARNDVAFLRHLGHRVLDHRPPTGFLRDLVVERKGEHVGHLDAKHGGITIIGNIARLQGVRAGIAAKETLDRLAGAATAGTLEEGVTGELSEAFRFLWEVRLRHQAGQVRGGEPPDDFVDPSTLGPVMRRGLKEAFGVISRAQRVLAVELGLHMP